MTKRNGPDWQQALGALEKARDIFLAQSQQAGSEGGWALARRLMDLAERADALRREAAALAESGEGLESVVEEMQRPARPELPASVPPEAADFPRYFVRSGTLVKQGLQRNGRDVYEHAVPRDQFERVLDYFRERASRLAGGRQKPFSVDDVHRAVSDLPKYMVYVAISLLLKEELLQQARKGAYLIAAPGNFATASSGLWESLLKTDKA